MFSLLPQRVASAVAGALGAIGLVLSAVGIAGLVAYSVSRRTREIGLRMALGARTGDVLRLEMRRGIRASALGLAVGTAAALLCGRLLSGFLFGVDPLDPLTFGAVLLLDLHDSRGELAPRSARARDRSTPCVPNRRRP
jgi:ABC-type antimicrobial peptide transport system permease subunit